MFKMSLSSQKILREIKNRKVLSGQAKMKGLLKTGPITRRKIINQEHNKHQGRFYLGTSNTSTRLAYFQAFHFLIDMQCFGSGSGIRCFFTPGSGMEKFQTWIRDL
jgi:hypothetical protein